MIVKGILMLFSGRRNRLATLVIIFLFSALNLLLYYKLVNVNNLSKQIVYIDPPGVAIYGLEKIKETTEVSFTEVDISEPIQPNRMHSTAQLAEHTSTKSDCLIEHAEDQTEEIKPEQNFDVSCDAEIFPRYWCNILSKEKKQMKNGSPDMRDIRCKSMEYKNLPKASIVIVVTNENLIAFRRTFTSVVENTPVSLVKEVIVLDDASEQFVSDGSLQNEILLILNKQISKPKFNIPQTVMVANKLRKGLEKTREMCLEDLASGDVLVFVDSHFEVSEGWLPPLLAEVGNNEVIVSPLIDSLVEKSSTYIKSKGLPRAGFTWDLEYLWLNYSTENTENHKAYPTPIIFEGIFAIKKTFYVEITLIPCRNVWGNENMDMSLRAWLRGGRVAIAPCARVFRIFQVHSIPTYNLNKPELARAITGMVWMDEWADFYLKYHPAQQMNKECKSYKSYVNWRDNKQYKSFNWYLDYVWPQHFFPTPNRSFGKLRNGLNMCLAHSLNNGTLPAKLSECGNDTDLSDMVVFTGDGKIMADKDFCLENVGGYIPWWKICANSTDQIWRQTDNAFKTFNGLCLTVLNDKEHNTTALLTESCQGMNEQEWYLDILPWK